MVNAPFVAISGAFGVKRALTTTSRYGISPLTLHERLAVTALGLEIGDGIDQLRQSRKAVTARIEARSVARAPAEVVEADEPAPAPPGGVVRVDQPLSENGKIG